LRLVVEDAAEMLAIGEDFGLIGQVGPAAVHQIEAGQVVFAAISCARRCFFTVIGK
jgi:hypothetical protein